MKKMMFSIFVFCLVTLFYNSIMAADKARFSDAGKGTITDTKTGLMWSKKCSYAELEKCLNWHDAKKYVAQLKTGKHSDWRLPTIAELKTIYLEEVKASCLITGYRIRYPLIFHEGALCYWSSEEVGSCCANQMYFNNGFVFKAKRTDCDLGGVRAVRGPL